MLVRFPIRTVATLALLIFTTALTTAHPATGIVVDRQGRVYFSDLETIWKLEPDGRIALFRDGVRGRHVHELFMDSEGNVYGSDISYEPSTQKYIGSVWKMSPAGELTWLQGPTGNAKPGMSNWIDRAGNMYAIDQNNHTKTRTLLLRRAPDGTVTALAGGAYGHADGHGSSAKFSSVGAMTFGPDGNLYLTDGSAVRKVTLDGNVSTVARDLDQSALTDQERRSASQGGLTGLAVDLAGTIYVADTGRRRLLRVKSDGTVDVVYRTEPPFFPNGVSAGHDGSIYTLEVGLTPPNANSGPRIRKISPDGKSSILVTLNEQADHQGRPNSAGGAGIARSSSVVSTIGRVKMLLIILVLLVATLMAALWWRRHRTQRA